MHMSTWRGLNNRLANPLHDEYDIIETYHIRGQIYEYIYWSDKEN